MSRKTEHYRLFARISRVLDGDTFFVECGPLGFRVRLADCNTPERGQQNYREATEFSSSRIEGKRVGLSFRNQQWDMHSRMVAEVWYGKEFDLNLAQELIDAGLAEKDPTSISPLPYSPT